MGPLKKMKFANLILILLFSLPTYGEFQFRGHNRGLFSQYYDPIGEEDHLSLNQAMLNSRTEVLYKKNDIHQFEFSYELFGSFNDFRTNLLQTDLEKESFNYRVEDLNKFLLKNKLYEDHSWQLVQNLDRLYYNYSGENTEFTLGRQIISFGSARTVNPTDILVPFDFLVVDMEQRNGVDALRLKYSLSELSEIDGGVVLGNDLKDENSAAFLTYKLNYKETDYEFLAIRFKEHFLYALDLQGQVFGIGIWLEGAYVNLKQKDDKDYLRVSFGGQYHFSNDMTLFGEYHFNGAGTRKESDYLKVASSTPFSEAGVFLLGRNYLNFGGGYPVNPLIGLSLSLMNNLDDQSSLFVPRVEWNFVEDYFLHMGGFYGIGKRSPSSLDVKSEFGSYPKSVFLILKHFY